MEPAQYIVDNLDKPTLVHCYAGMNRSGLVTAAALVKLGYEPEQAINLLRKQRFPEVLSNKFFETAILNLRTPNV